MTDEDDEHRAWCCELCEVEWWSTDPLCPWCHHRGVLVVARRRWPCLKLEEVLASV